MINESKVAGAKEPWGASLYGNPCRECNFNWGIQPTQAVSLVEQLWEKVGMAVLTRVPRKYSVRQSKLERLRRRSGQRI